MPTTGEKGRHRHLIAWVALVVSIASLVLAGVAGRQSSSGGRNDAGGPPVTSPTATVPKFASPPGTAAIVAIPQLVGMRAPDAMADLGSVGLVPRVESSPSIVVPKGSVVNETPAPTAVVPAGSTVALTVSSGP